LHDALSAAADQGHQVCIAINNFYLAWNVRCCSCGLPKTEPLLVGDRRVRTDGKYQCAACWRDLDRVRLAQSLYAVFTMPDVPRDGPAHRSFFDTIADYLLESPWNDFREAHARAYYSRDRVHFQLLSDVFILWNGSLRRPGAALSHTPPCVNGQWTMPLRQCRAAQPPTRHGALAALPLPGHSWKHSLRWTPGTVFRFLQRPYGMEHAFTHRVYHSPPVLDKGSPGSQERFSELDLQVDFTLVYEVYEVYESPKWLSVSFVVGGHTPWANVRKWNTWIAEPLSTRVGSRWVGL
jgi:hypothetical protein